MLFRSLGLELALTGLFWGLVPALALFLVMASLEYWFLVRQGRDLQSRVVVFLDAFAQERGLLKVRQDGPQKRLVPAG